MENNLKKFLIKEINDKGPMTFGTFMSHALGHPQFGYYMTRDPFGTAGDFTTAPEISQMFGEMIGAWIIDIWAQMDAPKRINIIECGAGRGTLLADIIRIAQSVDKFHASVHLHIIETSCVLRKAQKQSLTGCDIQFHNSLDIGFADGPCIIVGNEFLDALPVEQIRFKNKKWEQLYLGCKSSSDFGFLWLEASENVKEIAPKTPLAGSIYEVSPERLEFMKQCITLLKKQSGALLFIDYGHVKSSHGETVQAIQNHQYVPVLHNIGNCDITAHVDFGILKNTLNQAGLYTPDIITQGGFLKNLGIEHRARALQNVAYQKNGHLKGQKQAQLIAKDLNRLVEKGQMGGLFKVMCALTDQNIKPAGFS